MRIAVLCHAQHTLPELLSEYLVGRLAQCWEQDGHDVSFLFGHRDRRPADIALLHVDLSVVPSPYIAFALRYPIALNHRVRDIRKSTISGNLVRRQSRYDGPVFVKTNLNSAGIPEQKLLARGRSEDLGPIGPVECVKNYAMYPSRKDIPHDVRRRPGLVVEKFRPEYEGGLYFTRRCFVLGDRMMTMRMGYRDPAGTGQLEAFQWVDSPREILGARAAFGVDYGVIDYTMPNDEVVVLDVNKTIGIGQMQDPDERVNYERLIAHLAPGLYSYTRVHADAEPAAR